MYGLRRNDSVSFNLIDALAESGIKLLEQEDPERFTITATNRRSEDQVDLHRTSAKDFRWDKGSILHRQKCIEILLIRL